MNNEVKSCGGRGGIILGSILEDGGKPHEVTLMIACTGLGF
jgi:hypothetical protein